MKILDDFIEASAKIADQSVKVAGEAFEQARTFAGEAFEQAKIVTGEAYDKAQKKMTQLSLESDLAKAQRKLGALYYLMRKTGEDNRELLDRHYREVADIEEKLEALMADEEEISVEDVTRPGEEAPCEEPDGRETREDEPRPREPAGDGITACPICGAPVSPTDVYCPICGAKIRD